MAWRTVCRLCQAARPPRGAGTIGDAIDKAKKVKAKGKAKAVAKRVRFASDGPGPSAAAATPAPWAQGAAKQAAVEKPSSGGGKDEGVWSVSGLPQHGWPYAIATTNIRPDASRPETKVRLFALDPRAATSPGHGEE
jgi:hypothetical protein